MIEILKHEKEQMAKKLKAVCEVAFHSTERLIPLLLAMQMQNEQRMVHIGARRAGSAKGSRSSTGRGTGAGAGAARGGRPPPHPQTHESSVVLEMRASGRSTAQSSQVRAELAGSSVTIGVVLIALPLACSCLRAISRRRRARSRSPSWRLAASLRRPWCVASLPCVHAYSQAFAFVLAQEAPTSDRPGGMQRTNRYCFLAALLVCLQCSWVSFVLGSWTMRSTANLSQWYEKCVRACLLIMGSMVPRVACRRRICPRWTRCKRLCRTGCRTRSLGATA